jgi:hypothetical protein
MPVLTAEYLMGGVPVFSRRFFAEAFGRLKVPAVVVFDNYRESSRFFPSRCGREGACPFRSRSPLSSSVVPPAGAAALLKANGRMGSLGWDDLQLTQCEEAERIVKLRADPGRSAR